MFDQCLPGVEAALGDEAMVSAAKTVETQACQYKQGNHNYNGSREN